MKIERVKIEELTADPANVRKHNEKNMAAIKGSLRRFGQQKPIVVDADGIVRAGNGTLAAAISLGWSHIDIHRTELRGAEATAYAIADNRTAELAEWDEAALAQQLAGLQIEDEQLAEDTGFSAEEIAALAGVDEETDMLYTQKIKTPIYEPTGLCPTITDLYDASKRDELAADIEASHISPETKTFLIEAAQRHTVFCFKEVAEFYAHQPPEVQRLMEKSGLVIIDFNKAIEHGFVHMSNSLLELAGKDQENDKE